MRIGMAIQTQTKFGHKAKLSFENIDSFILLHVIYKDVYTDLPTDVRERFNALNMKLIDHYQ